MRPRAGGEQKSLPSSSVRRKNKKAENSARWRLKKSLAVYRKNLRGDVCVFQRTNIIFFGVVWSQVRESRLKAAGLASRPLVACLRRSDKGVMISRFWKPAALAYRLSSDLNFGYCSLFFPSLECSSLLSRHKDRITHTLPAETRNSVSRKLWLTTPESYNPLVVV